jgi:hypothetical protein
VLPFEPKTDPKPTPVPVSIPPAGTPTGFSKPAGGTDVKPGVAHTVPKTDFDVDLCYPTATDTYDTISQEYYNDRRYAAALSAFNNYHPLNSGRAVEVPPIHILKKKFAKQVGTVPVGSTGGPPSGSGTSGAPEWSTAPKPDPTRSVGNNRKMYVVPAGGLTLEAIAQKVGVRWSEIYDLNPQYHPGVLIASGTELQMPPTARLP